MIGEYTINSPTIECAVVDR